MEILKKPETIHLKSADHFKSHPGKRYMISLLISFFVFIVLGVTICSVFAFKGYIVQAPRQQIQLPIDFAEILGDEKMTELELAQIKNDAQEYISAILPAYFQGISHVKTSLVILHDNLNHNDQELDIRTSVLLYTTDDFLKENGVDIANFLCESIVGLDPQNIEIVSIMGTHELIYDGLN